MIKKIVIANLISYGIYTAIGLALIPIGLKVGEKIVEKSMKDFGDKN